MSDITLKELEKAEEVEVRPIFSARPVYGKLFKKDGVLDGKMFHTTEKATYTFISNNEVISLHFDREKKTIFYKGHNISNLSLTPLQLSHLELFKKELGKKGEMQSFVRPYTEALEKFLENKKA